MRALALLLVCASAQAQIEDEPAPSAVPAAAPVVPDMVLRSVGDRLVRLRRRDHGETVGRILGVDASAVAVAVDPGQSVIAIPRAEIVEVQLLQQPETKEERKPQRPRHFAIEASVAPGLHLDLDYRTFYGFFNFDFVLPAVFAGKMIGFATGAGVNFPLGKRSNWKVEAFALVAPMEFNRDWWVGLGVGVGFHWTSPTGFTFGIKIPVLGYTVTTDPFTKVSERFSIFYMSAAAGMPVLSAGYRF